jgi:hypothetical protein
MIRNMKIGVIKLQKFSKIVVGSLEEFRKCVEKQRGDF